MQIMRNKNIETRLGGHTAHNLGLPAGGIRRPQLRRLTHWGRRSCGNPWSLYAMSAAYDHPPSMAGENSY